MAATATQSNTLNTQRMATGRYLEDTTAAAFDIDLGFKPRYVGVFNVTSRDGMEWYEGMAAASALKTVAAGTRTVITTLGITVTDRGFTVGLDLDVNVVDEQLQWVAIG